MNKDNDRPVLKLVDCDGNAFAIFGKDFRSS